MIIPLAEMADDDDGIGALLPWMLCPIYTLNLNEFQVTVCSHDSLWFCHNGISNIYKLNKLHSENNERNIFTKDERRSVY